MSVSVILIRALCHHFGVRHQALITVCVVSATAGCGNTYVVPNGGAPSPEGGAAPRVLELTSDITIPDGTDWQMRGQAGARCVIRGNGHHITTTIPWTGRFLIQSCDIVGLGTADTPAIHLNMHGAASAVIQDSTFDASGQVHVLNYDASTIDFSRNTILATSLVPAVPVIRDSQSVFFGQGDGNGKKRFSGNLILHSWGDFRSSNWTIGGDSAAEGNTFIGRRPSLDLEGDRIVVAGNYTPPPLPNSTPQSP